MFDEIKNIKTEKIDLFKFGILFGIVLFILGSFYYLKINDLYPIFYFISIVFFVCALIMPNILKPLYLIWMSFALLMGWCMTRVILIILFYIILLPTGLILRILNKDLLKLKDTSLDKSYWNQRDNFVEDIQTYEKQY
tara:strand:+ start:322 stop:735 length:414 start_codon:yes stop_codon:yes gene_type:complete